MSPTIFDASQNEEQTRREELEREIEVQKELARQKASSSLPAREETQKEIQVGSSPDTLETSVALDQKMMEQEPKADVTPAGSEEPFSEPVLTEENDSMSTEPQMESSQAPQPESSAEAPAEKISQRDPKDYSELIRTEKPTKNPFAALSIRPANTYFDSQHDQEEILMVLRQHPIVNFGWIALSIVLVILPFTLFPLLPLFSLIPDRFQFFALIGWYLLVLAYMIESFLYWYFNIYIITDERIVDVDFYSLIYRSLSSAKIENIQDTTATTKGVLGAVFNYGDVTIQTAAEKREFEFLNVPQPATVTKFLNELILEEEREKLEGRIM